MRLLILTIGLLLSGAINGHLNCNHPTSEAFYTRYGKMAQKLGVVNYITRLYLSEIKLIDC